MTCVIVIIEKKLDGTNIFSKSLLSYCFLIFLKYGYISFFVDQSTMLKNLNSNKILCMPKHYVTNFCADLVNMYFLKTTESVWCHFLDYTLLSGLYRRLQVLLPMSTFLKKSSSSASNVSETFDKLPLSLPSSDRHLRGTHFAQML